MRTGDLVGSPALRAEVQTTSDSETSENIEPFPFIFFLEWEDDQESQKWRVFTLFMKLQNLPDEQEKSVFVRAEITLDCECTKDLKDRPPTDKEPDAESEVDPFDNECEDILEIFGSAPVTLSIHKHECSETTSPTRIRLKLTQFDFSKAIVTPIDIQKLIARRECFNELKDHMCEWLAPFDTKIRCKDGDQIDCHKMVLALRSPVFETMFAAPPSTTEEGTKRSNTIHATEVTSTAMKVILHFIYTGDLHEDWAEDPAGVVQGAHNYQLVRLLQFFDHHLLIAVCTKENAVKMLRAAEQHSLGNARKAISTYICKCVYSLLKFIYFNEKIIFQQS